MPLGHLHLATCEHVNGLFHAYLDVCTFSVLSNGMLYDIRRRKFPPTSKGLERLVRWVDNYPRLALVTRFPERWPGLFFELIDIPRKGFQVAWGSEFLAAHSAPGDAKTTARLIAAAVYEGGHRGYGSSIIVGSLPWPEDSHGIQHGTTIYADTERGLDVEIEYF